ncbi:hypothetical protein, partial [Enterococcus faecium]
SCFIAFLLYFSIIIFLILFFGLYYSYKEKRGMSYDEKIVLFIDHNDWLFDCIESWKYGIWYQ